MRTCDIDGCDKPHRSRGLCATHYNQTHQPNRHKPKLSACIVCEASVLNTGGGGRKYGAVCSTECRRRLTFGWSEPLPPDHWARWYGTTCEWKPPKQPAPTVTRVCIWCGAAWQTHQKAALYCSERCSKRHDRYTRRARRFDARGSFTWTDVVRLWIAFDRRCAYCLAPLPLPELQAEHVVPLSRGGRNDVGNLLPSCGPCNVDKGRRTLPEWRVSREARGLQPRAIWDATDPRLRHLVTS